MAGHPLGCAGCVPFLCHVEPTMDAWSPWLWFCNLAKGLICLLKQQSFGSWTQAGTATAQGNDCIPRRSREPRQDGRVRAMAVCIWGYHLSQQRLHVTRTPAWLNRSPIGRGHVAASMPGLSPVAMGAAMPAPPMLPYTTPAQQAAQRQVGAHYRECGVPSMNPPIAMCCWNWPGAAKMGTSEVLNKVPAVIHEGPPAVLDAGSTLA